VHRGEDSSNVRNTSYTVNGLIQSPGLVQKKKRQKFANSDFIAKFAPSIAVLAEQQLVYKEEVRDRLNDPLATPGKDPKGAKSCRNDEFRTYK